MAVQHKVCDYHKKRMRILNLKKPISQCHSQMDHFQLLNIVTRRLSPDTRLEVPASREEFDLVQEIVDTEEAKCTDILNIVRQPEEFGRHGGCTTPLHSGMAGALLTRISSQNQKFMNQFRRHGQSHSRRRAKNNQECRSRAHNESWGGALRSSEESMPH
ncbi:hypothetical protein V1515DRAFT_583064 [Lipomyces mesembrius]